jgi:homoserine O-succinyltransferase
VLAESAEGGVHMAASPDQFRVIYMQGHPEYDVNSLLKEYRRELYRFAEGERDTRRELYRFAEGERDTPPPLPDNYFSDDARPVALAALDAATRARETGSTTGWVSCMA